MPRYCFEHIHCFYIVPLLFLKPFHRFTPFSAVLLCCKFVLTFAVRCSRIEKAGRNSWASVAWVKESFEHRRMQFFCSCSGEFGIYWFGSFKLRKSFFCSAFLYSLSVKSKWSAVRLCARLLGVGELLHLYCNSPVAIQMLATRWHYTYVLSFVENWLLICPNLRKRLKFLITNSSLVSRVYTNSLVHKQVSLCRFMGI